ncbi:hypothetical protein OIO90_002181 [Microbotryomycetes sp. JL221]|nr:hypothetical protein OIO90_002181 [Microbotryomycetes sp. JL221]
MQPLPRSLTALVSAQLQQQTRVGFLSLALRHGSRPYSTADGSKDGTLTSDGFKNKMAQLQAKQVKMADKAGRMKRGSGMIAPIPIFGTSVPVNSLQSTILKLPTDVSVASSFAANHIPPKDGRTFGANTPFSLRLQYFKQDATNDLYSLKVRYDFRKVLGTKWLQHFKERTLLTYKAANTALTTGSYDKLLSLASTSVIDSIKAQRAGKLAGLRLSWKLHKLVQQDLVCVRQQEVFKQDEFVAQVAVRFVTEQSLEVRNSEGKLVGVGSHSRPQTVTEYYIFQRDMWRPDDDWTVVKVRARETDLIKDPTQQP